MELPVPEFLKQGLREFVVGAGLAAVQVLFEAERTRICGERYAHLPERQAVRAGHAPGELILGGRRVSVKRPRARTRAGGEARLASWEHFRREDPLNERALEQRVVGVSTRKYERSLEPVDSSVKARGTSKSAVSRRFVTMTQKQLAALLSRDLSPLALAILIIDGIHFGDHVILVALGIDESGAKHVLGLWEGATENSVACTALLTSLRERGLRMDRSTFIVTDGSKALVKAVRDVFGPCAVEQRCQVHKRRNVTQHLPEQMRSSIDEAMSQAYSSSDSARAKKLLENLARRLEEDHPSAAASLREGLDETLTVLEFHLPDALRRTLSTTNAFENLQGTIRRTSRRVSRWRGGSMILRWVGAAVLEAAKGFRRLKGKAGMPKLVAALRARDRELSLACEQQAA
jgi:transposase-like protein